jgi:hypothetical protein
MSSLHRIRVLIARFLILSRISQGGINHMAMQLPNAITSGFENEKGICYLISFVQMFYHMEHIRTLLHEISE